MKHQEVLIAGYFLGGPCDQNYSKMLVRDCWSGSTYATVAEAEWSDLDATLETSQLAKILPPEDRATWMNAVSARITADRIELAGHLVAEIGKPIDLALAEVDRAAITFRLSAQEALRKEPPIDLRYDLRSSNYCGEVESVPWGTVLGFVPYNWPYNLAAHKIGPALATGNRIVIKPSPLAAFSTLSLVRLVHEVAIGLFGDRYDARVLSAWNGCDADAQRAISDPRVDFLSFTGSARVGWMLRGLVPERPTTLELGGNAAAIVMEDADVNHAARRCAVAALAYSGQICISLQRLLVHESRLSDLLAAIEPEFAKHTCAGPATQGTIVGPMIHERAAVSVESIANSSGGDVRHLDRETGIDSIPFWYSTPAWIPSYGRKKHSARSWRSSRSEMLKTRSLP